jgi:response regulator RpfG family c-di-GMP phosphodiesterase
MSSNEANAHKPSILVVDDDNLLLKIFRQSLDDRYEFDAAVSGVLALEKIRDRENPYDVIVSDMVMPGMDGITLLRKIKMMHPDTVRVLLTGSKDVFSIADAVNQADIFRFLTKPLNPVKLNETINDAVKQHRLLMVERELLQNTLVQSVDALVKILEVTNGIAFALTEHVREYSVKIGKKLGVAEMWTLEIASLLSQVGCITIPELILERYYWGEALSPKELSMIRNHGEVAKSIVANIPRLEKVAEIVATAPKLIDAKKFGEGDVVVTHAAIIRIATEFDMLAKRGRNREEILEALSDSKAGFPEPLVEAMKNVDMIRQKAVLVELHVDKIKNGMYIEEDVRTREGVLIVSRGYRVNETVRNRLINFSEEGEIDHLVKVLINR